MESILKAAVYCGTYGKYNNGSLFGKWFNLADYTTKGKFIAACRELHNSEKSPEFMYQDWKNIPESLVSESSISDEVWHVINSIKKYASDRADEFAQWCVDNGAEQDYQALREFLNFKPAAKQNAPKNSNVLSTGDMKKAIAEACKDNVFISDYLPKHASTAAYFGDKLVVFDKPSIKTSFCYRDEGPDLENYYNFNEQSFINENLDCCQELRFLDYKQEEWGAKELYLCRAYDNADIWHITATTKRYIEERGRVEDYVRLTEEQEQQLQAILKEEKEKFVKRLQAYLKRYGLSKIKKWTYWADR